MSSVKDYETYFWRFGDKYRIQTNDTKLKNYFWKNKRYQQSGKYFDNRTFLFDVKFDSMHDLEDDISSAIDCKFTREGYTHIVKRSTNG